VSDVIKQLRELCDKATKGPWELAPAVKGDVCDREGYIIAQCEDCDEPNEAKFIAAARTALPAALDALEAIRMLKVYEVVGVPMVNVLDLTDVLQDFERKVKLCTTPANDALTK